MIPVIQAVGDGLWWAAAFVYLAIVLIADHPRPW